MSLEVHATIRILKPVAEVFDAVIDHRKMSKYFISGASGPMAVGPVEWEFGDVGVKVGLTVLEVEPNRRVVWESNYMGPLRTTMTFEADGPEATTVRVNESSFSFTEEGVQKALGQTGGWTHMLDCLKVWVQYGLDLRAGLKQRITQA